MGMGGSDDSCRREHPLALHFLRTRMSLSMILRTSIESLHTSFHNHRCDSNHDGRTCDGGGREHGQRDEWSDVTPDGWWMSRKASGWMAGWKEDGRASQMVGHTTLKDE